MADTKVNGLDSEVKLDTLSISCCDGTIFKLQRSQWEQCSMMVSFMEEFGMKGKNVLECKFTREEVSTFVTLLNNPKKESLTQEALKVADYFGHERANEKASEGRKYQLWAIKKEGDHPFQVLHESRDIKDCESALKLIRGLRGQYITYKQSEYEYDGSHSYMYQKVLKPNAKPSYMYDSDTYDYVIHYTLS